MLLFIHIPFVVYYKLKQKLFINNSIPMSSLHDNKNNVFLQNQPYFPSKKLMRAGMLAYNSTDL